MSFLQPWGLAVAGLVAVPLLLHLLRREVVQRVSFPALRYLRNAEQRTARSMRFRDMLLLATRLALLGLLAVAAARPLAGRGGAGDHAPTDVILLIDNSASMSRVMEGRTLLDLQIEAAGASLDLATPADRFWVVPAVGSPVAAGVDAAGARIALAEVGPTDAGADLTGLIAEATTAVPVTDGRQREVQVYTDGQASGFGDGPVDLSAWGRVAISAWSDAGAANGYVARLRLEPDGIVVPGAPPAAAVLIERSGEGDVEGDTVEVRLLIDGRTTAIGRAAWGSEVLIPLPDLPPGPHILRAESPASGLRADDARQLGILAADAPVARHTTDGEGFVAAALTTLRVDGRVRDSGADPVFIVEGTAGTVPSGGRAVVLIPPTDATRLPAFQQRLDALAVPWRLTGRAGSGDLRLAGGSDLPSAGGVRISVSHGLERLAAPATAEDSVLLRTDDGAPWLVRGMAGGRTYLLLASPLNAEATNLPVGAAMVPFVERLVQHWSLSATASASETEAGAALALPPRIETLTGPDGLGEPAEGGAPWTPRTAGGWTLELATGGEPTVRFVGVNVPSSESDVTASTADRVGSVLAGTDVSYVTSPGSWEDAVFGSRRGGEATPLVVGLALLLALVELVLAAPDRRSRSGAPLVA